MACIAAPRRTHAPWAAQIAAAVRTEGFNASDTGTLLCHTLSNACRGPQRRTRRPPKPAALPEEAPAEADAPPPPQGEL